MCICAGFTLCSLVMAFHFRLLSSAVTISALCYVTSYLNTCMSMVYECKWLIYLCLMIYDIRTMIFIERISPRRWIELFIGLIQFRHPEPFPQTNGIWTCYAALRPFVYRAMWRNDSACRKHITRVLSTSRNKRRHHQQFISGCQQISKGL